VLLLLSIAGCLTDMGGVGNGVSDQPVDVGPEDDADDPDQTDDDRTVARDASTSGTRRDAAVGDAGPARRVDAAVVGDASATTDAGRTDGSADAGRSDAGRTDPSAHDAGSPTPGRDAGAALTKLRLWIAGDSTVMTYPASDAPQEGWGQELGRFFSALVTVNNQALGGRSTRTFMFNNAVCNDEGELAFTGGKPSETGTRWERIRNGMLAGDYLLIQFGHNDAGNVCERHTGLPEFQENLGTMIRVARERGATPILITPMSQLSYKDGTFKATLTNYAAAMKKSADSRGVELVDLNTLSVEYYRNKGYDYVANQVFMPGETTHFQKTGAIALAQLIAEELRHANSALAPYLK
jgi:lysophospholipase L1-like esterase